MDLIHIRDILAASLTGSQRYSPEAEKSAREFIAMVDRVYTQGMVDERQGRE